MERETALGGSDSHCAATYSNAEATASTPPTDSGSAPLHHAGPCWPNQASEVLP
jgi:hypothetical protein